MTRTEQKQSLVGGMKIGRMNIIENYVE
jgi:hypothetical protein